jgi:hypothetical protein
VSMLKAKVMQATCLASASRSAYHWSVSLLSSSSRAENSGLTEFLGGFPRGVGVAALFGWRSLFGVRLSASRCQ